MPRCSTNGKGTGTSGCKSLRPRCDLDSASCHAYGSAQILPCNSNTLAVKRKVDGRDTSGDVARAQAYALALSLFSKLFTSTNIQSQIDA